MEGCRLQSRSSAITLSAGFGGGAGGEKRAGPEAPGAAEAKTAIESSGGDLNRATSIVFQRRLSKLQQENEELSVMLNELSAAGNTRPAAPVESEELHEALVSATWDAVAVMNALPKSRSTAMDEREDKRIAKRLKAIATAARLPPLGPAAGESAPGDEAGAASTATAPFAGKVLDIGCGDGTLLPHLVDRAGTNKPKKGKGGNKRKAEASQQARPETTRSGPSTTVQEVDVTGVDLSEVMISAAQQKYPKARWLTGNALALPQLLGLHQPQPLFSSIIFNGSLQFFRDPPRALADAKEWLIDGGHIVIAHVQGSDFVRDECRKNPRVAPSPMPGREGMEEWASTIGCSLMEGPDDHSQRDFLLQVMIKM